MNRLLAKGTLLGLCAVYCVCRSCAVPVPENHAKSGKMQLAKAWLNSEASRVTPAEFKLLSRAQNTLLGNLVLSDAWKPYSGIVPSLGSYKGVWNWDAAFHAIAVSHWDGQLAREQIEILFSRQQPDGRLPDVIFQDGRIVTTITKPPVMAWAVAVIDHRAPNDDFLRTMYPKLRKLGDYWLNEHGGKSDGLFYYSDADTGEESGWDNSIRWDDGYRMSKTDGHRLWAIDLNCFMVMHYDAMAYLAGRLHLRKEQEQWLNEARTLSDRINEKLWDEKLGFYVDRDRVTGKIGPALSPAGFMPLFAHIANKKRAARMAKLAASTEYFYPGMPTAAYNTPGYESHGYWRGSAWLNTSYFALKGLQEYGYSDLAQTMRSQLLDWVTRNPSIREYYDSRSGEGAGAKGFGWSAAFTISLILDWDNDHLTWLFDGNPARWLGGSK